MTAKQLEARLKSLNSGQILEERDKPVTVNIDIELPKWRYLWWLQNQSMKGKKGESSLGQVIGTMLEVLITNLERSEEAQTQNLKYPPSFLFHFSLIS